jgi:prepilin-type N-terminal cleavage/methylation domain-containing protein
MRRVNNNSGFSLVELSIVLVIIGLLVGLGGGMIGPMMNFIKVRETRDMQDANLQSIISWASSNNKIPNVAGFTTVAKFAKDTWNRDFIYLYDGNLYNAVSTKDTICGRRSTSLTLETTDNDTTTTTVTNVAFAVLSDADNVALKSTLKVNGTTDLTFSSGDATSGYTSSKITVKGPNGYMARWVTLDELRSKIGCQGAPLKIVNNELPYGSATAAYSATITADGGVPFGTSPSTYKFCINNLSAGFTIQGATGFFNADCLAAPVATWAAAAASSGVTITFAANSAVTTNTYQIAVVVRDNANTGTTGLCNSANPGDNCAQKLFVLTVNPQ